MKTYKIKFTNGTWTVVSGITIVEAAEKAVRLGNVQSIEIE